MCYLTAHKEREASFVHCPDFLIRSRPFLSADFAISLVVECYVMFDRPRPAFFELSVTVPLFDLYCMATGAARCRKSGGEMEKRRRTRRDLYALFIIVSTKPAIAEVQFYWPAARRPRAKCNFGLCFNFIYGEPLRFIVMLGKIWKSNSQGSLRMAEV